MSMLVKLGKLSRIGGGGISSIPGFGVFNLDFLDLQDAHGNTGTFTRAGIANVPDWQGVLQSIPLDTWRVNRGHYVENLINYSEDLTNAVWHKNRNTTATKTNGINTITFTAATADTWGQFDALYYNLFGTTGDLFRVTVELKGIAGETMIFARYSDGDPGTQITHTFSGQWETISIVAPSPQVNPAPTWGSIYFNRKMANTVTTLQIRKVWAVNVKGMPASYIPPYAPRLTAAPAFKWFNNDGSNLSVVNNVVTDSGVSNPLHPTVVINGEQTYLDLTDYATGQPVAAGGMRAYGGRYYKTAAGGTTNGASPLVDTGVTDWVDQGIYQPDYGMLFEGGGTNLFVNPLAPATQTIALTATGDYTLSVGDTGDTGTIAIAAGTATITGAGTASVGAVVTINCSAIGTVVLTVTGTLTRAQFEAGSVSTSFVNGIRQNELGNLKFPTTQGWGGANAFPHAAGSLLFSGSPQHDLSQHGNYNNPILSLDTVNGLLYQGWQQAIASTDGANPVQPWQNTAYLRNQSVQYGVEWDDSVPQFRVGYRVANTGMAWVWGAYSPYDGAFTDTGFLQFFANTVGALPWVVRNTIIFNKALTTQEWDNYIVP